MSYSATVPGSLYRQYSNTSAGSSSENLPPRTIARVARELRNLHKSPPEGVRLLVDGDNDVGSSMANAAGAGVSSSLEQVVCELQGPVSTPYEGYYFALKLVFSQDFPAAPPRGFFLTKLYHPNVDPQTGAICVNTLKRDWTAETTLCHVLAVIRCLLIVPFPESSLNDEAGKLFMESYEEYAKRARLMAQVHGRRHEPTTGGAVGGNLRTTADAINADQPLSDVKANHQNDNDASDTNDDPAAYASAGIRKPGASGTSAAGSSSPSGPLRSNDNNKKMAVHSNNKGGKLNKKKSLKRL